MIDNTNSDISNENNNFHNDSYHYLNNCCNNNFYEYNEYIKNNGALLHSDIINFFIKKYNYQNYLEVGTRNINDNFILIDCPNKECIDPAPLNQEGITYKMTSDEAFKIIKKNKILYDIIFIDGLHLEEQVDRDIKNSIECLKHNGTIILHDCNPPTEIHGCENYEKARQYTYGFWNGTVYKSIVKFNKYNTCCYVIETDWGCGVIRPNQQKKNIKINFNPLKMDWNYFDKNRKKLLNLKTTKEFHKKYKSSRFNSLKFDSSKLTTSISKYFKKYK